MRKRIIEWSRETETWKVLDVRGHIDDPTLAVPLSVEALLEVADTDDEVARALIAKRNAVVEAEAARMRAEGRAEGRQQVILEILAARGIACSPSQRARILAERDQECLSEWTRRVATCRTIDEMFAG